MAEDAKSRVGNWYGWVCFSVFSPLTNSTRNLALAFSNKLINLFPYVTHVKFVNANYFLFFPNNIETKEKLLIKCQIKHHKSL